MSTNRVDDILGDNIGYIEVLDSMGGDLANVNAARESYGNKHKELDDKDVRLIRRLADDHHNTPLRHTYIQLRVKAPEFVARQWAKHMVGCAYSFTDLPWSEFSQRYKEVTPELYIPDCARAQDPNNKQASTAAGELLIGDDEPVVERMGVSVQDAFADYQVLLKAGVAREQARIVLPLATYTEWVWTASLQAVVHFCVLRDHSGAQSEIQAYARSLRDLCYPLCPHSWDALEKNHPLRLKERVKLLEQELLAIAEKSQVVTESHQRLTLREMTL